MQDCHKALTEDTHSTREREGVGLGESSTSQGAGARLEKSHDRNQG